MDRTAGGILRVYGVVVSALVLAACSSAPVEPPEFQRPQRAADALPAEVLASADVVRDSTRLVGPWASTSVFVARSTDDRAGTCVVVLEVDEPDDWASSCLWSGGYVEMSLAGHRYRLTHGADVAGDEQWTELTTGVYAHS